MGSIVTKSNGDGSKSYKGQIVIKKGGKILHRESRTFKKEKIAKAWLKIREAALLQPGELDKLRLKEATLSELIDLYIQAFTNERTGRTKLSDMKRIQGYEIAQMLVSEISSSDLIRHVIKRRETVSRATANNDLIWIHSVFKVARPAFNIAVNLDTVIDAQTICYKQGLTGKSEERDRRPSRNELTTLMEYFSSMPRSDTPYVELCSFLLFSGRRCSEMTRIRWRDVEPKSNTVYIENMKHPRRKWGNHMRLKLTARAMTIIEKMPRGEDSDRVFPFSEKTLSTIFTRACRIIKIEDLHLHDLRHECISNLFEQGYQIHEVAMFSGHRSWDTLKRYTHLSEIGMQDKWEGWEWLP